MKKIIISIVIPVPFLVFSIFLVLRLTSHCFDRLQSTPEPDKYPSSILIDSENDTSSATLHLETTASSEQILAYYEDVATCFNGLEDSLHICEGSSSPFGKYIAIIEKGQNKPTTYTIYVEWDQCDDDYVTTE